MSESLGAEAAKRRKSAAHDVSRGKGPKRHKPQRGERNRRSVNDVLDEAQALFAHDLPQHRHKRKEPD